MSQTEKIILSGLLLNSEYSKKVIPFVAEDVMAKLEVAVKKEFCYGIDSESEPETIGE